MARCVVPTPPATTCLALSNALVTKVTEAPGTDSIAKVRGSWGGPPVGQSSCHLSLPLADLNECETLLHVCGAATCANVEGSFLCICPGPGEEFDPMTGRCSAHPLDAGEGLGGVGQIGGGRGPGCFSPAIRCSAQTLPSSAASSFPKTPGGFSS